MRAPAQGARRLTQDQRPPPHRSADGQGQITMIPSFLKAVVRFQQPADAVIPIPGQSQQQPRQVIDMDQRGAAFARGRHHAPARGAEQGEHITVARAIDCRWTDNRPVKLAGTHQILRCRLGRAIERKPGLPRGERRNEDEPPGTRFPGRLQQVGGASDIARIEHGRIV